MEAARRPLLEAAPMSLALAEPRDGSFVDLNEDFARLLDRPRADVIGRRWQDLTHPEDLPGDLDGAAALAEGRVARLDRVKRFVRPDGSPVWVRVRTAPGDLPGGDRQLWWVWGEAFETPASRPDGPIDAALYERSLQLEAANAAKGSFLANMSHEIRTPLGVISGLAELLRREAGDARQRRRLNLLFDTTQHVLGVVNDILDLSKIEAGELALTPEVFELRAVLDRVHRLFRDQAREKGLTFATRVELALRTLVLRGDALRLSQVLINLCSNAIKFTERGGVELSIEALRLDEHEALLRFAVDDTGPGVQPGLRAQLFQPFVQGDVTTARRFGGTGLGLAIVQRLVTLMGGDVLVDSDPGRGSTFAFEIVLPRAAPRPHRHPRLRRHPLPIPSRLPRCPSRFQIQPQIPASLSSASKSPLGKPAPR